MSVLEVRNLCKHYPAFTLDNVSFTLEPGKITGFIGRNGAGKSTTLNALLRIIRADSGEVRFFGLDMAEHEGEIKQRVGFVSGGVDYYPQKKLKTITAVTRSFYSGWDEGAYRRCLELFNLDENKTPKQLSAGMRVKYALALALSHRAELLILDEPTSGLDPVSRDELLDVLNQLCREGHTILFSTHITSDLDKCADNILYIRQGRIAAQGALDSFTGGYRLVRFADGALTPKQQELLLGAKREKRDWSALVRTADVERLTGAAVSEADLESIMVHLEREVEA